MDTCKNGSEIADHIRLKVIYEGLELAEIGIDPEDITDDVLLFDEDGLNLDSIDALEIIAGVQREFGLSLPNVDQAFIDEHCTTVGRLASMVAEMSSERVVRSRPRDAGAGAEVADTAAGGPAAGASAGNPRAGSPADS